MALAEMQKLFTEYPAFPYLRSFSSLDASQVQWMVSWNWLDA
jgi:hypothetical protein